MGKPNYKAMAAAAKAVKSPPLPPTAPPAVDYTKPPYAPGPGFDPFGAQFGEFMKALLV